jgi:MFS transporter, DHA2 family, multidrug resistance protein
LSASCSAASLGAFEVVLDVVRRRLVGIDLNHHACSYLQQRIRLVIPWEMTRRKPAVDVRMLTARQFGSCFLVMLAASAILLAIMQFLPELVPQGFRPYGNLG